VPSINFDRPHDILVYFTSQMIELTNNVCPVFEVHLSSASEGVQKTLKCDGWEVLDISGQIRWLFRVQNKCDFGTDESPLRYRQAID
jgi:hypothetical protein